MVETATKISLRNVELNEKNAELQKKIDWLCEVFDYGSDESMQGIREKYREMRHENYKTKVMKNDK